MFGTLVRPLVNLFDVFESVADGEGPSKRQVAQLIDDGVSIAAIAAFFGVGLEAIENLVEDR